MNKVMRRIGFPARTWYHFPMAKLLQFLFDFVIWVFVPLIMATTIYLTRAFIAKAEDKKTKSAMRAGFWAGFLLFIILLVYDVSLFLQNGFPANPIYQGFSLFIAIIAGLVTFIVFLGGRFFASDKLSGMSALIATFVGFYVLANYLFIRTHNELVLSLTLGITFGVLAHFAVSPSSLRRTLKGE